MKTVQYAPGRSADLYGDPAQATVLLWHGMQTDARASVRLLAEAVAGHGLTVVAPDWNSHAEDGGRGDLLQSLEFARSRAANPDGLVLVGWSLGGAAAAGVTLQAAHLEVVLAHTVCLAGAFTADDPVTGNRLTDALPTAGGGSPVTLLHGTADDVVPAAASRAFAAQLESIGWPVEIVELDTDHGAIAGARYDDVHDRYLAADDAATQRVVDDVAARIAAVTGEHPAA
ncbi:MAG: esterase [Mycobacterium sp.]